MEIPNEQIRHTVNIYSIKDVKPPKFFSPFTAENHDVAVRHFSGAFRDPNSQWNQYPDDFELWCLGAFDQQFGELVVSKSAPEFICSARDLLSEIEAYEKSLTSENSSSNPH